MNNPFGLPDEVFNAVVASTVMGSVAPGMKKTNPDAVSKETFTSGRCKSSKGNL